MLLEFIKSVKDYQFIIIFLSAAATWILKCIWKITWDRLKQKIYIQQTYRTDLLRGLPLSTMENYLLEHFKGSIFLALRNWRFNKNGIPAYKAKRGKTMDGLPIDVINIAKIDKVRYVVTKLEEKKENANNIFFVNIRTFIWNKKKFLKLKDHLTTLIETNGNYLVRTTVWTNQKYGYFTASRILNPESMILEYTPSLTNLIMNEELKTRFKRKFEMFLHHKELYDKRGISHKLSYLFYGIPGTGKSTLVKALAVEYKLDVFIINLNNSLDDFQMTELIDQIPPDTIILIEDIDSLSTLKDRNIKDTNDNEKESKNDKEKKSALSLSCFLNILDGVNSINGSIICMSTNDLKKLDAAIYRPGRVDELINLPLVDSETIVNYFSNKYSTRVFDGITKLQDIRAADINQIKTNAMDINDEVYISNLNNEFKKYEYKD